LLIERPHLPCMVHAARSGDDLVLEPSALAHGPAPYNAGFYNVPIALWSKGDPPTEPLLLAQRENLLERVTALVAAEGEVDFPRGNVPGVNLLDVPLEHRPGEPIAIDDFARERLLVATKGRGGQADDFRLREAVEHLLPAFGDVVMSLVDEDHVEEVGRELRQPAVG